MGLVGREIVQTQTWIDPNAPKPPSLNYKETFPITVFEAVRRDMNDEDSETLLQALEHIEKELMNKQPIFPGKSANFLMTFAGAPGAVSSIAISQNIPWDPKDQSNSRIPTEKAVGDLLFKLGLVDQDGNIDPDHGMKVRWSDVIGRPLLYDDLGWNDDGFMTQKAVTTNINILKDTMESFTNNMNDDFNIVKKMVTDHTSNISNPHHVTVDQIGAISKEIFESHLVEINPHHVTKEQIGLENVDNTSDLDKPISKLTQNAIEELNKFLNTLKTEVGDLNYVANVSYDQPSGALTITYRDNTNLVLNIPIDGLVDEIKYDSETKELVVIELSGNKTRVNISELFVRYYGSIGPNITVQIEEYESKPNEDGRLEITREKVRQIWNKDGKGSTDADPDEIDKPTVDGVWNVDGVGDTEATEKEITKEIVDYTWETDGLGPFNDEDGGLSDSTGGSKYIIRAFLNELSVTENLMADNAVSTRVLKNFSITNDKIMDMTITGGKLVDRTITSDKLAYEAVSTNRLANRAVTGAKLFSSDIPNRVLAVRNRNTDPVWTQITPTMLGDASVTTRSIKDSSVTREKLADKSVSTRSIENGAVTNDKLGYRSITNNKIEESTIEGHKLVNDPEFIGTPTITQSPSYSSNNHQIPDTSWVKHLIQNMVITNENIGDRIVDGRSLFTSSIRKRALVVNRANSDPEWGLIENEMIAKEAIDTDKIINNSVTNTKIKDKSIETRHFTNDSIKEEFLKESSVSMNKIAKSDAANMVLAALSNYSHPQYSKVTRDMLEVNAIGGTKVIEDHSIPLSKLVPSSKSHRILGTGLSGSNPEWMQVTTGMISNHAVTGEKLFLSPKDNRVLACINSGDEAQWLQVLGPMIAERTIGRLNLDYGCIWEEHLQNNIIEAKHIFDRTITSDKIAGRAITGVELFTSEIPNRILGVSSEPYSNPQWLQVTSDMIEDKAIDKRKFFRSKHPYRVLGVTQADVPPEYLMITNDFIMDNTITSGKLVHNFVLHGTPELTVTPKDNANNHQIPDTSWVRNTFKEMIKDFDSVYGTVTKEMLQERSVDGTKLFTSDYDGPRVLGVTKKGEDPEYILIEEDLIVNGSVTTNKLQRDIHLLGSPVLDIRPAADTSDSVGNGDLIPDCQWVLDRITEAKSGSSFPGSGSSGGGTTGASLVEGSVLTKYLQDRAVTGAKLFSSIQDNRVLAVLNANEDPKYVQVNSNMIADKSILSKHLFSSGENNRLLGVNVAGESPKYIKVNNDMMEDESISRSNIQNRSVDNSKIEDKTITFEKLADQAMIDSIKLFDKSVTTQKIDDGAVETEKIKDEAVTNEKLAKDLILKGIPTVESNIPLEQRSLRNTIISNRLPKDTDGEEGDIWIVYI